MPDLRKKIETLPPFLRVLGILLFNSRLGTSPSYARATSIFKIEMFILTHYIILAAQNAANQRMTKYHPAKYLTTPDTGGKLSKGQLAWLQALVTKCQGTGTSFLNCSRICYNRRTSKDICVAPLL